jgi:hypothetical protein
MTAFTSGPWHVFQHIATPTPDRFDVVGKTRDDDIAENITGIANARLIAAAPTLYDALAGMIPSNVCLTNRNVPDSTVVPCDVTMGELRTCAAALAKARGEAR